MKLEKEEIEEKYINLLSEFFKDNITLDETFDKLIKLREDYKKSKEQIRSEEKTKFLVRPRDFHIWDLDESNGCYRSYSTRSVTYSDGTRPNANPNYTFDNLVNNYGFIPITEDELPKYEAKNDYYTKYTIWSCRSDGHGGSKGGTEEEYEAYLRRVEAYNKSKNGNF